MEAIKRLIRGVHRPDLVEARAEARDARCALQEKVRDAREKGLTVSLSKEALERITRIEPAR